jgi:tetratricopeptide (TPR) repeat protein
MKLSDCYKILGVGPTASMAEVKAAYRVLARRYHPDANLGDRRAQERFIQVSIAYKTLLNPKPENPARSVTPAETYDPWPQMPAPRKARPIVRPIARLMGSRRPSTPPIQQAAHQTQPDYQLKIRSYGELRALLQAKRFPKAIELADAMAARFAGDLEVLQWQAVVYRLWGKRLIQIRQLNLAKAYLIRSAQIDPNNQALRQEIDRDLVAIQAIHASVNSPGF